MRVLYVVYSSFWSDAALARGIMEHIPRVTGVMCSLSLLDELLKRALYLEDRVDIVHFMLPVAGRRYLNRFLGKIPCVSTIHHIEPGYVPEAIPINVRADAVMVVAKMWQAELVSRGAPADRVFIVPNGVDTNVFRPASEMECAQLRRNMGFAPDETVIGYSGKPGRDKGWRKGVDVLFQALEILVREGKRVGIVVGGPGWGESLARLRAMGIKTYWRRYVHRLDDIASLYQALDFYWVTSRIEGGPRPLLEAMSSEVCCLSTKVGIAPEVIKDGINGHLVDIGDASRSAQLTLNLMGNESERKRMGQQGRKTILSNYDCSQTAMCALALYEAAITNFEERLGSRHQSLQSSGDHVNNAICNILMPKDARWLEAHERLIWAHELYRMGERPAAVRLAWRACLAYPTSKHSFHFAARLISPERARRILKN